MKIGILLYTYNRTDDARINMEIIRSLWNKNEHLKNIVIVHAFNGEREWWPEKYLEDETLYLPNAGHFGGAEILLNEGMKYFSEKYPEIEYIITLAADTWLVKPEYISDILEAMKKDKKYLATCAWGNPTKDNMWNIGMALDFNVTNIAWAMKTGFFPLRYQEFCEKYLESFMYRDELVYLERVFALRFKQAILKSVKISSENRLKSAAESFIHRMIEREPVHDVKSFFKVKKGRKMYWPELGLITHHEPEPKRDILRKMNLNIGNESQKLITATDLSYYNRGLRKNIFKKDTQ